MSHQKDGGPPATPADLVMTGEGPSLQAEISTVRTMNIKPGPAPAKHATPTLEQPKPSAGKKPEGESKAVELRAEEDVKIVKREAKHRIFVNRSLYLEKTKFFGFDMDYTIAVYASPQYEAMSFSLFRDRLVATGYPTAIKDYEYDPSFPVRGLWWDSKYGLLLKTDPFGNVLVAVKGFKPMTQAEINTCYPNRFVQYDEHRIYILNTLFNLPEMYLLACLVDFFTNSPEYVSEPTGVKSGDLVMSFMSIFQDVRDVVDYVHNRGELKKITVSRVTEFVVRDDRLPVYLERIREQGAKVFLLTNSDYNYTERVMSHLLGDHNAKVNPNARDWLSYFDYIVVNAHKPRFFSEGSTLREIDLTTGAQRIGIHVGPLKRGQVYSGGSCDVFSDLIGAKGKDVLYFGDSIHSDIMKSKKIRGWRTFLIIPEMTQELYVWTTRKELYTRLALCEAQLNKAYQHMDSTSIAVPDTRDIQANIVVITHELDLQYGFLGSIFKSGSRATFFANQVMRFADLYSGTFLNLLYYPFFYMFKAPPMLLPHESTVEHLDMNIPESEKKRVIMRSRSIYGNNVPDLPAQKTRSKSLVPHLAAETPLQILHHHDDDAN